jgi:hypothetical protein
MEESLEGATVEMAKRAIQEDKVHRQQVCSAELEEILQKYRCTIVPMCLLRQGNVAFDVQVVAQD